MSLRFIDSAHCLDSGQCKERLIVDRTHPVLVRAVLQKNTIYQLHLFREVCRSLFITIAQTILAGFHRKL